LAWFDAAAVIAAWRRDYNEQRLHAVLGERTPAELAKAGRNGRNNESTTKSDKLTTTDTTKYLLALKMGQVTGALQREPGVAYADANADVEVVGAFLWRSGGRAFGCSGCWGLGDAGVE